ncbi:MAG TPA: ATP-grasp domain-containing protein [Candidatus Saccharimonadales bacterium]|nr:ATP-grasp domain-containing protein [Candidatus Saccharimonadales bacterium]
MNHHTSPIKYDADQPLGTVSLSAQQMAELDRYFTNVTFFERDHWPHKLSGHNRTVTVKSTAKKLSDFLLEPALHQAIAHHLPSPATVITARRASLPESLSRTGYKFVALRPRLFPHLENKVNHRELLSARMPYPDFAIYDRAALTPGDFPRLADDRDTFVLQDEQLSSGVGTFVIREPADLGRALSVLRIHSKATRVVVSNYISGARERSVQAVVTSHGTFVGPLSKQIIRDPQLTTVGLPGSRLFCGGEIDPADPCRSAYPEIKHLSEVVGDMLRTQGYRGIFGLDFLVKDSGQIYFLELNARPTSMTPLLTQLERRDQDIPFYLLNLLEWAEMPYSISGTFSDLPQAGSMLALHPPNHKSVDLHAVLPGIYKWDATAKQVSFVRPGYRLDEVGQNEFLLEHEGAQGTVYQPGERLLNLYFTECSLNTDDSVKERCREIVAAVYALLT